MTDEAQPNGRVTTRDLLYAMQGMEGRIGERIDRLEMRVDEKHLDVCARAGDNAERIAVLEQEERDADVRAEAYGRMIGWGRILLMTAIAVGSFGLGIVGAVTAINA